MHLQDEIDYWSLNTEHNFVIFVTFKIYCDNFIFLMNIFFVFIFVLTCNKCFEVRQLLFQSSAQRWGQPEGRQTRRSLWTSWRYPPICESKHRMPARTKTTRFYSRWKPRTADEFWSGTCARLKRKKKASLSRVPMFSRLRILPLWDDFGFDIHYFRHILAPHVTRNYIEEISCF